MTASSHSRHAGYKHSALESLQQLLEEKPENLDSGLIAATRCLVNLRDELIARSRNATAEPRVQEELRRVNAIISLLVGTHYPLVGIQWDRLKKARDALADSLRA